MTGENVRASLHNGTRIYGTHVTGLSNAVVTRILGTAPLDFAFICAEHMPVDRAETAILCQHFASLGISPIVRVPSPDPVQVAMALDAGAEGIVVPYVETVEEVRQLVGAVHYRPIKGRQLRAFLDGTQRPTDTTQAFLRRFNRHHYLIIGVESVAAYQNLETLIGVDGVDGVFMGPHDLSVSLEVPEQWEHPALLRLIEDTVGRCRTAKVGVGVHLSQIFSLEQTQRFTALGMNWILDGADVIHVVDSLRQRRAAICGPELPALPSPSAANGTSSCISGEKPAVDARVG